MIKLFTPQLNQPTEQALNHTATRQGLPPDTIIKNALLDYLAEEQAITKAGTAYKNYLDGKESIHDFDNVVKKLGLDA